MKTIIANDRIGRFAELDHAVREEVQVILESPAANDDGQAADEAARPLDWLRAALQKAIHPTRPS